MSIHQNVHTISPPDFPAPLDIHLNVAVMHMAHVVCPSGFEVSDDAPSTFAELISYIDAHRAIKVPSIASEKTIYADREVNYCFRAWHDWCHWRGRHDFSLAGETAVWKMQCDHLRLLYGDSEMTRDWCRILYVEIVVQWLFREKHGAFPEDQMAFTRNYFEEQTTLLIGNLPNVMIEHS